MLPARPPLSHRPRPHHLPRLLFTLSSFLIACVLAAPGVLPARVALAAENAAPAGAGVAQPAATVDGTGSVYFSESGHNLSGGFLTYWLGHGQAATLGAPLTDELQDGALTVQYFEKTRLEYNPAIGGTNIGPSNVGTLLLADHPYPRIAAFASTPTRIYFSSTGHGLGGGFYSYFNAHGGQAVFGAPISEELGENGHTVQYFERARFELISGSVQLGNIGTDLFAKKKPAAAKTSAPPARPAFAMAFDGRASNFPAPRGDWQRIINLNISWGNLPRGYKGYGLYAAMPADLHLYGRWAKVSKNGKSIWVQLIDVVAYKDLSYFRSMGRVIDLGTQSFQQFAPLKAGIIRVHVDVAWPGQGPTQ